jgi:hypothetical protein
VSVHSKSFDLVSTKQLDALAIASTAIPPATKATNTRTWPDYHFLRTTEIVTSPAGLDRQASRTLVM